MKIEFIKRGADTRLILIYSGWSTTPEFYRDMVFEGWDTAVVYDYTDLKKAEVPQQYKTIYLFAYSLGVWAADISEINATVRTAIAGTPLPVSDTFGIPEQIYVGTETNLDRRNLMKFHRRMAGDKASYTRLAAKLPSDPDISHLKEELANIRKASTCAREKDNTERHEWHRAYIPEQDAIMPTENQKRWWTSKCRDTETVMISGGHAVDLKGIISSLIPDHAAIGGGFRKSLPDYKDHATVQGEAAHRIVDILSRHVKDNQVGSLLEIGSGPGLLTELWQKILRPDHATFIDLYESNAFGAANDERYIVGDAEQWLENCDERFDVIVSASAIQWFADPIRFLREIRSHLNKGGIAVISTFVKGNLHQLDAVRPSPIIYRSTEEYSEVADQVESWTHSLEFGSAREALMHLKHTGVSGSASTGTKISDLLTSLADGILTYSPAIIIIKND